MSGSISGSRCRSTSLARPDNAAIHRTGAIYGFKGPDLPSVTRAVGEWNEYEITVDGADLTVVLNGQTLNQFHFTGDPQSPRRGQPSTPQDPRFIGLQTRAAPHPRPNEATVPRACARAVLIIEVFLSGFFIPPPDLTINNRHLSRFYYFSQDPTPRRRHHVGELARSMVLETGVAQ
jgi:hypothetical protein